MGWPGKFLRQPGRYHRTYRGWRNPGTYRRILLGVRHHWRSHTAWRRVVCFPGGPCRTSAVVRVEVTQTFLCVHFNIEGTSLTYVRGCSHLPDSAERNTASITAIFLIESSMGIGTSPSPRIARENTSP